MAGAGKGAGVATGAVFGGFCLLGFVMFAIAATIVLSLIGTYPSNNSKEPLYGSQYRVNAILLKMFYGGSNYSFSNGTIVDSSALSALCGQVYLRTGAKGFANCVAKNFTAVTNGNTSKTARRRRQTSLYSFYASGVLDLYHTTACEKVGESGKYTNDSGLSACAKKRLAECDTLSSPASDVLDWGPLSSNIALQIYQSQGGTLRSISIDTILGFSQSKVDALAASIPGLTGYRFQYKLKCQFVGRILRTLIPGTTDGTTTTISSVTTAVVG